MAHMLYLLHHYLNRFHFEWPHGGRPYPTMGNECVFKILKWDFWKETFFKTSLVNKKSGEKNGHFYKNYNIW